jgi:hypothetical protein
MATPRTAIDLFCSGQRSRKQASLVFNEGKTVPMKREFALALLAGLFHSHGAVDMVGNKP